MYCKNCGAVLKEGQKFCSKCGTPVAQVQTSNTGQKNRTISHTTVNETTNTQNTATKTKERPDLAIIISVAIGILLIVFLVIYLLVISDVFSSDIKVNNIGDTLYDNDGLTITYEGVEAWGHDWYIDIRVSNNTGKTVTITPLSGEINDRTSNLDPRYFDEIKSGYYSIGQLHARWAGDAADVSHATVEFDLNIQYDLNGELTSENIGHVVMNITADQIYTL